MAKKRKQAEQVADAIIKGFSSITERNGKCIISFQDGSNLELEADHYTRQHLQEGCPKRIWPHLHHACHTAVVRDTGAGQPAH